MLGYSDGVGHLFYNIRYFIALFDYQVAEGSSRNDNTTPKTGQKASDFLLPRKVVVFVVGPDSVDRNCKTHCVGFADMTSIWILFSFVISIIYLIFRLFRLPDAATLKRRKWTKTRVIVRSVASSWLLLCGLIALGGIIMRVALAMPL